MMGNIVVDGALQRVVQAMQGLQLTGSLPKESGREIVAIAKSIRLFVEARETAAAKDSVDMLAKIAASADDKKVRDVIDRQCASVRKAMQWS